MPEPTREQIKEAFNKTIERWERIVGDVSYYYNSNCALCDIAPLKHKCSEKNCPIFTFTDVSGCDNTPYPTFVAQKTPANALAELNFLRKVYIWWMEKEANKILDKVAMYGKEEEKKEEWEKLTNKDLVVLIKECGETFGCFLMITDNNELRINQKRKCYLDKENCLHMEFYKLDNPKYKLKVENGNFRILKKI